MLNLTVTDAAGATATGSKPITVTDALLEIEMVDSVTRISQDADIACVLDANAVYGLAGDLTVSINWGGGATTAGTVVKDTSGECGTEGDPAFRVLGTHTYAGAGDKKITVTVTSAGRSTPYVRSRNSNVKSPAVTVYGRRRFGR